MAYKPPYLQDIFEGDGRRVIDPVSPLPGTAPIPVRRATAQELAANLETTGHSVHSANGSTLWVTLAYCSLKRLPYTMRCEPGAGYYVELMKPMVPGTPEPAPAAKASPTEHDIRPDGVSPHNGEHWYKCRKYGASDWIASYGELTQLDFYKKPCKPK